MALKFGLNSIVVLAFALITLTAWIFFEIYHQKGLKDIPKELITQAGTSLDPSFDSTTLKKLYERKDNFNDFSKQPANNQ